MHVCGRIGINADRHVWCFLFLLLLIASMYAQAAIFQYLGISDETEKTTGGDEALVAAAIAVKLKNG